jgi:1-acyl-sn-glycerol-3-phosphate acyltransferase
LYITVNRGSKSDRALSIEKMKQSLSDGISVFICPEGTRNKTGKPLLDFRDGAFRLAIETQVPLAILVIKDSEKKLSPLKWNELAPGSIHAGWCGVIETEGMQMGDVERLKETAREEMLKHLQ